MDFIFDGRYQCGQLFIVRGRELGVPHRFICENGFKGHFHKRKPFYHSMILRSVYATIKRRPTRGRGVVANGLLAEGVISTQQIFPKLPAHTMIGAAGRPIAANIQ